MKTLLRDLNWKRRIKKSYIGSDWLGGNLCSKYWKLYGIIHIKAQRGDDELGVTVVFTHVWSLSLLIPFSKWVDFRNKPWKFPADIKIKNTVIADKYGSEGIRCLWLLHIYTVIHYKCSSTSGKGHTWCSEKVSPFCENAVKICF